MVAFVRVNFACSCACFAANNCRRCSKLGVGVGSADGFGRGFSVTNRRCAAGLRGVGVGNGAACSSFGVGAGVGVGIAAVIPSPGVQSVCWVVAGASAKLTSLT